MVALLVLAFAGAAPADGTGALIGVALPPPERWVEAPLPRSPPLRPGAGLQLSIRF